MHIHILGVCGTFIGGLAVLARAAGHKVTGCDANVYPPMSTQLAAQGIELVNGYDPDQVDLNPDMYVIGNVITRGNPLMEAILNRGLPHVLGPQWLREHVLQGRWVLAVGRNPRQDHDQCDAGVDTRTCRTQSRISDRRCAAEF